MSLWRQVKGDGLDPGSSIIWVRHPHNGRRIKETTGERLGMSLAATVQISVQNTVQHDGVRSLYVCVHPTELNVLAHVDDMLPPPPDLASIHEGVWQGSHSPTCFMGPASHHL